MERIEDEILMAYADGELSSRDRATLEAQLVHDTDAQERLQVFRESRDLLAHFGQEMATLPVPPALHETLQGRTRPRHRQLRRRLRRSIPRRTPRELWQRRALAASLILALGVGYLGVNRIIQTPAPHELSLAHTDPLLERALEFSASGMSLIWPSDSGEPVRVITPLMSFRDNNERICREYEQSRLLTDHETNIETLGVACRGPQGGWFVQAEKPRTSVSQSAPDENAQNPYLPASGDDNALESFDGLIDQLIVGAPLSIEQEKALMASDWQD